MPFFTEKISGTLKLSFLLWEKLLKLLSSTEQRSVRQAENWITNFNEKEEIIFKTQRAD